jgi:hypothetical protein
VSRKRLRSKTARAEKREQKSRGSEREDTPDPLQMTFEFTTPEARLNAGTQQPRRTGSDICPECGTAALRLESGCATCPNCGHSDCPLGDMPD